MLFCDFSNLNSANPIFTGWHGILALVVVVMIALCCIAAMWVSPVSGAITVTEQRRSRSKSSFRTVFVLSSIFSILTIVACITLLIFPVACSSSGYLVSAAEPSGSSNWHTLKQQFLYDVNEEETSSKMPWYNLAPIRDKVVAEIYADPQSYTPEKIAKGIHTAVRTYKNNYKSFDFTACDILCKESISPSLLESIELGILQSWYAYTGTHRQQLKYFVSDRAHRYNWNWKGIESLFPNHPDTKISQLEIHLASSEITAPTLSRVITATQYQHSVEVIVLFTPNDGGDVELALTDDAGKTISLKETLNISSSSGVEIKTIQFDSNGSDLTKAKRLVQYKPGKVERDLPEITTKETKLYIAAEPTIKSDIEKAIRALTTGNMNCKPLNTPVHDKWHAHVSSYFDLPSLQIVPSIDDSNLAVFVRPDGGFWVLPRGVYESDMELDKQFSWIGNRTLSSSYLVEEREFDSQVLVLGVENKDALFSLDKLGIPREFRTVGGGVDSIKVRTASSFFKHQLSTLSARAESQESLRLSRLIIDPWRRDLFTPIKSYLSISGRNASSIDVVSFYAMGFQDFRTFCNMNDPIDQELFVSFWNEFFQDLALIKAPHTSLSSKRIDTFSGAPRRLITNLELRKLSISRSEKTLLLIFSLYAIYFTFIIINVRNAYRA